MVPLDSHEVPRASQYSGTGCVLFGFEYGAITRCGGAFQLTSSAYSRIAYAGPTTPNGRNHPVWALPISLAATLGIDVSFSSSAYLDVSVQRVSPHIPIYSVYADKVLLCRVSPFGNLRIYSHLHLPAAYRSLSRPSSAPNAKAFSMCSSSLDLVVVPFAYRLYEFS